MRFKVTLKPNAKQEKVEAISATELRVHVKAPPVEGRANAALCELLAEHFGVRKAEVELVGGYTGRHKWVEVRGVTLPPVKR